MTALLLALFLGGQPDCVETERAIALKATAAQLESVLGLLSQGLAGQKFVADDGTVFTITKVHDLVWKGGVEATADVDFDHSAVSGTGRLPVRVELRFEADRQRFVPKVRLTGPIRIVKSKPKDESFGFLATGGARLVEALSETQAFQDEFSHRAEAQLKPPSIPELLKALKAQLKMDGVGCVAAARLEEWSPSVDALALKGKVTVRGPGANCCP